MRDIAICKHISVCSQKSKQPPNFFSHLNGGAEAAALAGLALHKLALLSAQAASRGSGGGAVGGSRGAVGGRGGGAAGGTGGRGAGAGGAAAAGLRG